MVSKNCLNQDAVSDCLLDILCYDTNIADCFELLRLMLELSEHPTMNNPHRMRVLASQVATLWDGTSRDLNVLIKRLDELHDIATRSALE
jgi:hypothetical protein